MKSALYFNIQRTDFKESKLQLFGCDIFYMRAYDSFGWFSIIGLTFKFSK